MTVDPGRMLAFGCAGSIKEALLGQDRIGSFWVLSPPDGSLALGNLVQRAAQVHGSGPQALLGSPGDRAIQGIVELEHSGTVAEAQ